MNLLSDLSFTLSWLSSSNNNLLVLFLTFQVLLQVWILYAATPDSLRSSNSPHRIPPCYNLCSSSLRRVILSWPRPWPITLRHFLTFSEVKKGLVMMANLSHQELRS